MTTDLYAAMHFPARVCRYLFAMFQGRMLGWNGAHVPGGSKINGRRRIQVGVGFHSVGPVWIDAIESYAGQTFTPAILIGEQFRSTGRTHIGAVTRIEIGANCLFGGNVTIVDHAHGDYSGNHEDQLLLPPDQRPLHAKGPIKIGRRVWVGENVVILGGVTIGDGAVIGANSVVTKDVPPGGIAAGVPAKVLRVTS